jgi:hypothetical protein
MSAMSKWSVTMAWTLVLLASPASGQVSDRPINESIVFPKEESVLNLRRDFGARGDGIADDTAALQKGLDASCGAGSKKSKILFIPNGVYRVTAALLVRSSVGPWVYGESRDGVIIRLADGITDPNCTAVLRTHPLEEGKTSADWFMRNFRNLTIDVGKNPGVDGIRWYGNNTSILKNLRLIGQGKIAINSGFLDQSGPNLIQDVVIDGYDTGILSQWIWSQTLSRVTIRNCRTVGLVVSANVVAIEDLTVDRTPIAIRNEVPNNWGHWGGVIALVGARLTGGSPDRPAIINQGVLYARDIQTSGFQMAIQGVGPAGNVPGPNVAEYSSSPARTLFDSPPRALALPIRPEPRFPWENDPANWVCANDFGAAPGDNKDDTAALQKAIDTAAAAGKTTVYLRAGQGGDPNWYNLNGEVRIHSSVRHIVGLGFGRILGRGEHGKFIVSDDSAPVVKFQHLQAFGGGPAIAENRSTARTMIVEGCDLTILGTGTGPIFATDCASLVELRRAGQKCWARQLNPEGTSNVGLIQNAGADLWVLGSKFEGEGVRYRTSTGGRTEVLGMFNYHSGNFKDTAQCPMFDVDNAAFSISGLREITFGPSTYPIKVREKRGGETRKLDNKTEGGWIGWSLFSAWQNPNETPR